MTIATAVFAVTCSGGDGTTATNVTTEATVTTPVEPTVTTDTAAAGDGSPATTPHGNIQDEPEQVIAPVEEPPRRAATNDDLQRLKAAVNAFFGE